MAGGFESLSLMPEILRSVEEMDWHLPTDIQDEAIPLILGGGDVMAAAETGSGKTGAFSLPMIQCVYERLKESAESKTKASNTKENDSTSAMEVEGDGKGDAGVIVKLCHNDKDNMVVVSEDGTQATGQAEKQWTGGRATHGVVKGRYYFEATVKSKGICRIGFSSMAAHTELGRDAHGFGYGGTGMKSNKNSFEKYGQTYGDGDTIGCYIELEGDNPRIVYSKNGEVLGEAFKLDETARKMALFPAYVLKGATICLNFGATPFKFPLAAGFTGMCGSTTAKESVRSGSDSGNDPASDLVGSSSAAAYTVRGPRSPMAIILEPARDLAEQVYNNVLAMSRYVHNPELKTLLVVGGDDTKKLGKALAAGVDIIVGTVGKVGDLLKAGALSLANTKFFILDEADRMVDDAQSMQAILQLYSACPSGGTGSNRLQVCFFSATLHSTAIKDLAAKICVNPTWVDLKGVESVPDTVHHVIYRVSPSPEQGSELTKGRSEHILEKVTDAVHTGQGKGPGQSEADVSSYYLKEWKLQALVRVIDAFDMSQCIIFCRTNVDCNNLESFLCAHGGGQKFRGRVESGKEHKYSCCVLAGMRSMQDRRAALDAFKEGDVRFMICTDVAARGIDIKSLPFVINMTLPVPDESENYIHRIGRVGRADRMGLAISLVAAEGVRERVWYHKCKDRGKGCINRALVDRGGCTMWMDESASLAAIEKRIHQEILPLRDDFSLPAAIAEQNVVYGEEAAVTGGRENLHLEMLGPTVVQLGSMEVRAQSIFHALQSQFGRFQTDDDSFNALKRARKDVK